MLLFGLCWGSFLNVVGYRLIAGHSLITRSFCPHCTTPLAWYDLIPVFSWIILNRRCRSCKHPIRFLYPFIELLTASIFVLMYCYINPTYWFGFFMLNSSLIVSIRSDLESMLVSRDVTLPLIPLGYLLSFMGLLPVTLLESILGSICGYVLLWMTRKIFWYCTHKEGMGLGDLDLLALIGAFVGPLGCWITVLIGSIAGSILGGGVYLYTKNKNTPIPFGPFLAWGTFVYIFLQPYIFYILLL